MAGYVSRAWCTGCLTLGAPGVCVLVVGLWMRGVCIHFLCVCFSGWAVDAWGLHPLSVLGAREDRVIATHIPTLRVAV
jgi:hypothetical protein